MHQFAAAQEVLVHGAVVIAVTGLLCIVIGLMFGARLRRLGARSIGVSLFVLVSHFILITMSGPAPPLFPLVLVYRVVALMLLQAALNLLFGPSVGSRVTADLLSALSCPPTRSNSPRCGPSNRNFGTDARPGCVSYPV